MYRRTPRPLRLGSSPQGTPQAADGYTVVKSAAAALALGVTLSALAPALAPGAGAQVVTGRPTTTTPGTEAHISEAVRDVPVDSPEFRALDEQLQAARALERDARAQLVTLGEQERELAADQARAGVRARVASERVGRLEARMDSLAVRAYTAAGSDAMAAAMGDADGWSQGDRRALMGSVTSASWRRDLARASEEAAAARADQRRLEAERAVVLAEQDRLTLVAADARSERRALRPELEDARATAVLVGSDLTLVAYDAYVRSAMEMARLRPECALPWYLLAGIGRVESGHGTYADSVLDPAGTTGPPIIGIALDGGNGTRSITDSDGGRLDGDVVSDRAVGPMQFIPTTWASYAADGNGDGVDDPQNIYDAALAAGNYLCAASSALDTPGGREQAIFAYNHSSAYVADVSGYADEYARFLA